MTNAQIYRLRDLAPHWFDDYRDRSGSTDCQAMLDDARELVSDGTHQLLNAGSEIYLVTPIKPPVVGHIYQIGCEAI